MTTPRTDRLLVRALRRAWWFLEGGLPGGAVQRDSDGTVLITCSRNGTTSLTPEGVRRALARCYDRTSLTHK